MRWLHPTSHEASSDSSLITVCPHLGAADDRSRRFDQVAAEHRCYRWPEPREPSSEQQSRFCLTGAYVECPWLLSRTDPQVGDGSDEAGAENARVTDPTDDAGADDPPPETTTAATNREVSPAPVETGSKSDGREPFAAFIQRVKALRLRGSRKPVQSAQPQLPDDVDLDVNVFVPSEIPSPPQIEEPELEPAVPGWRPEHQWECVECYTHNPPEITLCQQCGRVAPSVEQMLRAREELFVLDGLKALQQGDEEAAHRCFVVATEHDPSSEIAWYWRARTGDTVDEVIDCLETILRLNPTDKQVRRDLELARARKAREASEVAVEIGPRDTVPAVAVRPDPTPSRLSAARRTALELASIPSFALGLFCARPLVLDVLAMVGIRNDGSIFPVFDLPVLAVTIPSGLAGTFPDGINVLSVLPVVLAIWYVRLAFQLVEGTGASRVSTVASGAIAIAATSFIPVNGELFFAMGILLVALGLFGMTRRPRIRS